MAANFSPPPSVARPEVPGWVPPQTTKQNLEWADLRTIELSLLDSLDPEVVRGLVETTKKAIKDDGFLFLMDFGVSIEQVGSGRSCWRGSGDRVLMRVSCIVSLVWHSICMRIFRRRIRKGCYGILLRDCLLGSSRVLVGR